MSSVELDDRSIINDFTLIAIVQGRLAYLLMSIHGPNPAILASIFAIDPYIYIYANMLYGIAVLIYTRPSMTLIKPPHRFSFSIMGSIMFNNNSCDTFNWIYTNFGDSPIIATILGMVLGRVMMVYLIAFLYHMDSRIKVPGINIRKNSVFENMYVTS